MLVICSNTGHINVPLRVKYFSSKLEGERKNPLRSQIVLALLCMLFVSGVVRKKAVVYLRLNISDTC